MQPSSDPWAEIVIPPPGRYSRRRVDGARNVELYWYRDESDHTGLLLLVPPSVSNEDAAQASLTSRGVTAEVRNFDAGPRVLTIRLEESSQKELFLRLCDDLVERALSENDASAAFAVICRRLKRWQEFLSRGRKEVLSANEVRGLFAELTYMSEALETGDVSDFAIVKGWYGPERGQHDFVIGDKAIEIKALAGSERDKVRISSEDQLASHLGLLLLRIYFLADVKESSGSESLNEIVRRLSDRLANDPATSNWFVMRLAQSGYIDIPHYDTPRFRVKDVRTYDVRDGFPRLTPLDLPAGVEDVSYHLLLAVIEPFRTDQI